MCGLRKYRFVCSLRVWVEKCVCIGLYACVVCVFGRIFSHMCVRVVCWVELWGGRYLRIYRFCLCVCVVCVFGLRSEK